jgi:Signal transduction histidine kinase
VLIVLDDLTEQGRRELAEREFVANAAHELRTPLTTIIGAVEVLQAGAKDDPLERDRFLAHIERESARLARLARALLTLARAHAGQERPRSEPIALRPLLQEVADDLRPRPASSSASSARPASARSSTVTCSSRCCGTSARTP